jgi:cytoskeletal protein CcmA (bactofilin family)
MIYFIFIVGVMLCLVPFLPAVLEAVRKTDTNPLRISRQILKDPRANPEYIFLHFAHSVGFDDMGLFKEKLAVTEPLYFSGTFLAIPGGKVKGAFPKTVARVISADSIELPSRTAFACKILSMASIVAAENSLLNEIHANETLEVKKGCKLVWWASANHLLLQNDVNLPGKIQAKTEIRFNGSARFHYLAAPSIRSNDFVLSPSFLPVLESPGEVRTRNIEFADFEIKANASYRGDLIVKHDLILRANAKIQGSVKCHGKLTLEKGAQIIGNVVGLKHIELSGENWINGSILGNTSITIGKQVLIGSEPHAVTCSAREIRIRGPFQVHGVLRAWKSGDLAPA